MLRLGCAALLALAAFAPDVVGGSATMIGRSSITGGIDYPDPYGVWFAGGPCVPTQWSMSLGGTGATADLVNNESVAGFTIQGSGSSPCSLLYSVETGTVTLSVSAGGLIGFVQCPTMTGTYTRDTTDFAFVVSGDCTLNGKPEPSEQLSIKVTGVPTSIGGDFGEFNGFALAGTAAWS